MKKSIIFFLLFLVQFVYCQNIGLISNINPKLGYIHSKAGLKFNPVFETELDYDLNNFINKTFAEFNITTTQYNDFEWNKLGFFDEFTQTVPVLDYLKYYSTINNIDELYIIRKINSFKLIGPMDMFFNFKHNFGIMTFPSSEKRALMYYNFGIYKYSLSENKVYSARLKRSERMEVYINQKFASQIYDNNKILIGNTVQNYFLPIFENHIKNSLTKLINQEEKEVVRIFK